MYGILNQRQPQLSVEDYMRLFGNNYSPFATMPQPAPEQPLPNGAIPGYPMPVTNGYNPGPYQQVSLPTTKENDTYKQYFGNPQDSIWSDYYADKPRDAPLDTNQYQGFENSRDGSSGKYPFNYDWSKIFKMPGPQLNPNNRYAVRADAGNESSVEFLNRSLGGRVFYHNYPL